MLGCGDGGRGDGVGTHGDLYARNVGAGLRRIRLQKGMSLQDVQAASHGVWKAAVVGAYERGDRNVTIARLAELAEFYDVPLAELLPEDPRDTAPRPPVRRRLVLNLENLERVPEADRDALERFAAAIQVQRGDFNGRVLTIREDDLMALALLYRIDTENVSRRLEDWGLI
jgi:transcriptional regulator with XRE-family HTH domain